jgi:hypothetical protein
LVSSCTEIRSLATGIAGKRIAETNRRIQASFDETTGYVKTAKSETWATLLFEIPSVLNPDNNNPKRHTSGFAREKKFTPRIEASSRIKKWEAFPKHRERSTGTIEDKSCTGDVQQKQQEEMRPRT